MRPLCGLLITAAIVTSQAHATTATTAASQPQQPGEPPSKAGPLQKPGCNARTLPAFVGRHSDRDEVDHTIRQAIDNIRMLRNCLDASIRGQRVKQTVFDSGVLGLGTASVATAFFTSSIPAIGAIAIAAQSLQQYRSYYNPEAKGAALIKALASARCVSSNAEPLLNAPRQQLWQSIANLQLAIIDVHTSAAALAGADKATVDAADATSKAMTAANSALAALNAEAGAYNNAPAVIDQAHDAIKDFIDRSSHRSSSPDFATITAEINSGIKTAATSDADAQLARAQLMDAVVAKAKVQVSSKNLADAPAPIAASPVSLAAANLPARPGPEAVAAAEKAAAAAAATQIAAAAQAAVANTQVAADAQTASDAEASKAVQAVADAKAAAALQGAVDANAAVAGHAAIGPTSQNVSAVSALIAATVAALQQMPNPPFTTVNNNITLCIASF